MQAELTVLKEADAETKAEIEELNATLEGLSSTTTARFLGAIRVWLHSTSPPCLAAVGYGVAV